MNALTPSNDNASLDDEASLRQNFEKLFDKHQLAVLRFLSSKVFHLVDAEDLAAETWTKAFSSFNLEQVPHFRQWIITIARNNYIDWVRRRSKEPGLLPEDFDPSSKVQEITLHQADRIDAIRECIEQLLEPFRSALRAKFGGRSYSEISERFSIPIGTVGSQLSRARHGVRACVEGKLA